MRVAQSFVLMHMNALMYRTCMQAYSQFQSLTHHRINQYIVTSDTMTKDSHPTLKKNLICLT